jgi:hypothetical protein
LSEARDTFVGRNGALFLVDLDGAQVRMGERVTGAVITLHDVTARLLQELL